MLGDRVLAKVMLRAPFLYSTNEHQYVLPYYGYHRRFRLHQTHVRQTNISALHRTFPPARARDRVGVSSILTRRLPR